MTRRPNVVLICTDQQRYDSLGCTGNAAAETPRLDALAEQACVFDRHFTANPVCMPSRASLMTGLYPATHGVWTNGVPLPRRGYIPLTEQTRNLAPTAEANPEQPGVIPSHVPTIADRLAGAGYATTSIGKLHLTPTNSHKDLGYEESRQRWRDDPSMQDWHGPFYGFEHVWMTLDHGHDLSAHYQPWLRREHPDIAAQMASPADKPTKLGDLYPSPHTLATHPTTWVADRACDRVDKLTAGDDPFFMWVGIPDPHHPWTPPRELAERFAARASDPIAAPREALGNLPPWLQRMLGGGAVRDGLGPMQHPDPTLDLVRRYTDAQNHLIDRAVGQIIDKLQAAGVWDDTILVFTSDHGDFLGDYGMLRKGDTACRVLNHTPLLVRVPEGCGGPAPGRVTAAVSNVDLTPSLCNWCGVDTADALHGQDLAATARGETRRLPVMAQVRGRTADSPNLALYDERYRVTLWPNDGRIEAFDHAEDPMELNDLGGDGASADVRDRVDRLRDGVIRTLTPVHGRVSPW